MDSGPDEKELKLSQKKTLEERMKCSVKHGALWGKKAGGGNKECGNGPWKREEEKGKRVEIEVERIGALNFYSGKAREREKGG